MLSYIKGHCSSFLSANNLQYLISLIRHTPDIYLSELQHQLEIEQGVTVHESTISQSLGCSGYSMKNVSISALEQNEDDHCQYLLMVGLGFSVVRKLNKSGWLGGGC